MAIFKTHFVIIFCFITLSLGLLYSEETFQKGQILFLVQKGEHVQALKKYQEIVRESQEHDFDLLHRIGLGILDYGYRQTDPEIQLLTLFGAGFSLHEEAFYIIEGGIKNKQPAIQLVAVSSLSQLNQEKADSALQKAMGSPHALVRYEAAKHLCRKKNEKAVDLTESLMHKLPPSAHPVFPDLYASVGDHKSIQILKKMINDPSEKIRQSVIISAAKFGRDDLLPQIRRQAGHYSFRNQEVCAFAIGEFRDEQSHDLLNKLCLSQYKNVRIAANLALEKLGDKNGGKRLAEEALRGNLLAIATLGECKNQTNALKELLKNQDLQIQINAGISLLKQNQPLTVSEITPLLIRDHRELAFIKTSSPGKSIEYWKVIPSSSQLLNEDSDSFKEHIQFKEWVINRMKEISLKDFYKIASLIFNQRQNDLIPLLVEHLVILETDESINLLKDFRQTLGAPFIRNYCHLGLYLLNEKGEHSKQLENWILAECKSDLIQFKDYNPWEIGKETYLLAPKEKSQLLIAILEAFVMNQDPAGIDCLIEILVSGHPKNKYAIAGILVRATH